jgi:filamentous hemagglutinin family protein
LALAGCALAFGVAWQPADANPQGGVVVAGSATIAQPSTALLQVQQFSQNAVINWQGFSIGGGEAVRFLQPSSTASVLNRVVGSDPSRILGSLSANGRVYLVNQNGVFVGPDAQIDAAALVMSTADIRTDDFMSGRLDFSQPGKPGAKIVNEGRITAREGGLAALVAPGVENRGVISARLGQVVLGGAPAFSLDLLGDGMVNILLTPQGMRAIIDATGKPLASYVDTTGRINAEGGRIWIGAAQARGIVDSMVNIGGELRATRVAQRGGEITLLGGDRLDISGSVVATSADGAGGTIGASADRVTLAAGARVDASGSAGGGTVLVGGAYQGRQSVAGAHGNARTLSVADGAQVRADATAEGKGGQVVLWSDEDTRFAGSVSARGGALGGDGGVMEVSGKKTLAFDGRADASAARGQAGTLLLDPGSLTVEQGGTGGFSAAGSDSTVAASTLNAVLRGGTSVALQADDDIRVNALIDARPFAGSTDGMAGAGLSLAAGRAVEINAPIVLNDGAFTVRSGSFRQADGNVIATLGHQAVDVQTRGDIQSQYLLTSGAVRLQSTEGNVTAARAIGGESEGTSQPVGSLSIRADAGTVGLAGGARVAGDVSVQAASLGTIGGIQAGGDIGLGATRGNVLLGSLESTGAGTLRVDSAGDITLPAGSRLLTRGGSIVLTASGGRIDTEGLVAANDPAGGPAPAGSIRLEARDDLTVRQLAALGSTVLQSGTGSILLKESLGGTDRDRPALGSLQLAAGRDITINGLNLAGSASVGLEVEAGRLGQGGRILVNERIGVSTGNLRFGSATASFDRDYAVVLRQSVYARTGTQNITFNVPVVVDGGGILAGWRAALNAGAAPASLIDMILIPNNVGNEEAEALVAAGGGFYVRLQPDGKPAEVCSSAAACGPDYALMVPKLVISNQEKPFGTDTGTIRLAGDYWATKIADLNGVDRASAALKLIAPLSAVKPRTNPDGTPDQNSFAEKDPVDHINQAGSVQGTYRAVEFTLGDQQAAVDLNFVHLQVLKPSDQGDPTVYRLNKDGSNFLDALPVVTEYGADPKTSGDPVSLSLLLFPGKLNSGVQLDNGKVIPSGGDAGFSSNSAPSASFVPVSAVGTGVDLSAQILAALPPAPSAPIASGGGSGSGGGGGSGGGAGGATGGPGSPAVVVATPTSVVRDTSTVDPNVVVAANALARDAAEREPGTGCGSGERVVVGRARTDEADVGGTSALRGAPAPVFRTSYALGTVSPSLTSADRGSITGSSGGNACQ